MKSFDDLRKNLAEEDPDLFLTLEFAGTLMAARLEKSITQRELSRLTGIPQKTISRIENGIDIPKIPTLIKLANVLGYELRLVDKEAQKEQSTE